MYSGDNVDVMEAVFNDNNDNIDNGIAFNGVAVRRRYTTAKTIENHKRFMRARNSIDCSHEECIGNTNDCSFVAPTHLRMFKIRLVNWLFEFYYQSKSRKTVSESALIFCCSYFQVLTKRSFNKIAK